VMNRLTSRGFLREPEIEEGASTEQPQE